MVIPHGTSPENQIASTVTEYFNSFLQREGITAPDCQDQGPIWQILKLGTSRPRDGSDPITTLQLQETSKALEGT
jgi:hypothetical protein